MEIEHLLATELEVHNPRFTGRTTGTLNMREGKVARMHAFLAQRQLKLSDLHSTAYSDSRNDIPLLARVSHPVAVDPDPALRAYAESSGWPVQRCSSAFSAATCGERRDSAAAWRCARSG